MDFVAEYHYVNPDGTPAYTIKRTSDKQFIPFTPDGKLTLEGIDRVLYNLPAVLKASNEHGTVWVTEGEKSADLLISLGLVATCSSGGANFEWPRAFANYFAGCERVYVLPDNDAPGLSAAAKRARHIASVCQDVRIVELDGLNEKQDVYDWLQYDTVDNLWKQAEYAKTVQFIEKKITINVDEDIIAYILFSGRDLSLFRSISDSDFADPFCGAAYRAAQAIISVGLKPDVNQVAVRMLRAKYNLPQKDIEARLWALVDKPMMDYDAINTWIAALLDASTQRSVENAAMKVVTQIREGADGAALVSTWEQAGSGIRRSIGLVESAPNLTEFLGVEDKYDWLIPDFMERRDRMIFVGGEGKGKAVFLRQLAIKAGAGIDLWDDKRTNPPVNVLIIDRENSPNQIRRTMNRMSDACHRIAGTGWEDRVRIQANTSAINLLDYDDRMWFESELATNRPDLVVCLPIYKLFSGDSSKDSEKNATEFAKIIDDFRERYDCAFIFEAHAPLGDENDKKRRMRPFGSSVWMRWPELGWGIVPEDRPHHFTLETFRGNRSEIPMPEKLYWNPQPTGFPWLNSPVIR